ncbi:MAG: tetratricopeptide repeat protein [Methyloligellaceae bacterium]
MFFRVWPVFVLSVALGACQAERKRGGVHADLTGTTTPVSRIQPSGQALVKAQKHFAKQDYGLAEKFFREAVEHNSNNTDAWIGLAASYDHLRRFDLADRAYKVVVKQAGYTVTVHNNRGYHYYLQGKMAEARKHFVAANRIDPANPYVLQNLELVEAEMPRRRRSAKR